MRLLLHSCCADCTLKFVHDLDLTAIEATVFFYNPNIHPKTEYLARLKAMQQVCSDLKIKLIIPNWRPAEYFEAVKVKQKPSRCYQCWQLRLAQTADYAMKNGFETFSSTLLSSKYLDENFITKLGQKISTGTNLKFFIPDKICRECQSRGFYRQNYCGCCFSLIERMEEKFPQPANIKG